MKDMSQEKKSQTITDTFEEFEILELFNCKHEIIETNHNTVYAKNKMVFTVPDSIWKCSNCDKLFKLKELDQ